jgi:hypothetical protein
MIIKSLCWLAEAAAPAAAVKLHVKDLSSLPGDLAAAVAELQQQQKQLEEELQQR